MSRLDKAIADVAYVLDCMMAYRQIARTGNCNDCGYKKCTLKPEPGQLVRYNCPFYTKKEEQKHVDADD